MRKTEIILAMLAMLWIAPIASADIRISVISYKSETQVAKILVANIGTYDHTDLSFALDNSSMEFKGSVLKPRTGFIVLRNAMPGIHTAKVQTKEGEYRQKLLFARTAPAMPENLIIKGQDAQQMPKPEVIPKKGKPAWSYIMIIFIALLAIAGASFAYFRYHPEQWQKILAKLKLKKPTAARPISYQQPIQTRIPIRRPVSMAAKRMERAKTFEKFGGKK
jgi:hypothetical protein